MRSPEYQPGFARALLDPDMAPPDGLRAWSGAVERRFNVYRNNVTVSLTDALATSFPICVRLVGEDFFRAMARAFLRSYPPVSPVMCEFGQLLPTFIREFEPAKDVPYLADVAVIEAGRIRAYHAVDAEPVDIVDLARLAPESLTETRLLLHPSLTILRSQYPVCSIWQGHQDDMCIAPEVWQGEDLAIVRPHMDVMVHRLLAGEADFIDALTRGLPLGKAAAWPLDDKFDLSTSLARIFGLGLVVALTAADQE